MALDISTLDPAKTVVVATGNPHKVTEIEAILARLSEELGAYGALIGVDYETMAEMDFIFARAHLAVEQNASRAIAAIICQT